LTATALTTGAIQLTNLTATNISTGTLQASASNLLTTAITTANVINLSATNNTITNLLGTNISTGTLQASSSNLLTTAITTANVVNLSATNNTNTNLIATNISTGTLRASSSNLLTSIITSGSILNLTATNNTFVNALVTNLTTGTLQASNSNLLTSIITTGSILNLVTTNITSGTIRATNANFVNVTSTNFLSTNISTSTLQATNNTLSNILALSITTGTVVVSSSLNALGTSNTIGSIFTTGGNVGINTTSPSAQLQLNTNSDEIGFVIKSTTAQTQDLLQIQNSSGTVIAEITSSGDVYNNAFLLYGRDHFYTESLTATSTTSTTFQNKLTGTTGNLSGGDYMLGISSLSYSTVSTTQRCETRVLYDGSNVTLNQLNSSNNTNDRLLVSGFSKITLSSGVHTFAFQFRSSSAATSVTVENSKLWLFRCT
jgi:hypothetical protein